MKHHLFPLLLMAVLPGLSAPAAKAQSATTNLPTSMYGVGELTATDGGRYAGMGQVGVALNRPGLLNTLNPAAITRMDTACFHFDVGATLSYARYSFLSEHSTNLTGMPNRFCFGLRVMPRCYALVGVTPYSSVGYFIRTTEEAEGMPGQSLCSTFEGEGGLYRCFTTHAFALTPQWSVGVCLGMVIGKVTQGETQESAAVEYVSTKRSFYADFGLHYSLIGRSAQCDFGLVFAPSIRIGHDNSLTYDNSSTSETVDKGYHTRSQYLPMRVGAGMAVATGRYVLTADYNYVDWSRNSSAYTSMTYENQHKFNLGGICRANPRTPRSVEWMAGVGFSNSYISLKGGKMYYLETSAGVSVPLGYSFLSVGTTWRKQINSRSRLMQESRWSLNLSLTFGERVSRSRIQ